MTRTSPERLHLADRPLAAIPSVPQLSSYRFTTSKPIGTKQGRLRPRGFWYGFGMAWLEQYRAEMHRWAGSYLYELKVDTKKLVRLSTEADVRAFMRTFEVSRSTGLITIAWDEVAKRYDGIEIYPYLEHLRYKPGLLWYCGWGWASGCIWNSKAVKDFWLRSDEQQISNEMTPIKRQGGRPATKHTN